MPKKKNKKKDFAKFIVKNREGIYGDNVGSDTLAHAEKIADAQKLLYKGKYAIYELVRVVE